MRIPARLLGKDKNAIDTIKNFEQRAVNTSGRGMVLTQDQRDDATKDCAMGFGRVRQVDTSKIHGAVGAASMTVDVASLKRSSDMLLEALNLTLM